jgi:hypothetical protein
MVETILEVESMLKDILEINDFFLSSHFMICLLHRVSAACIGRPRTMIRPCEARFAQNFFLAVNVFSLRGVMEACVTDSAFAQYVETKNRKKRQALVDMKSCVLILISGI